MVVLNTLFLRALILRYRFNWGLRLFVVFLGFVIRICATSVIRSDFVGLECVV